MTRSRHIIAFNLFFGGILWVALASTALAAQGVFLNPSLYYASKDTATKWEGSQDKSIGSTTMVNATLGLSFGEGLLIGGKYIYESYSTSFSGFQRSETRTTLTAAGISLGFKAGPLCAIVSALAIAPPEKKIKGEPKLTYNDGGGMSIDVMYLIKVDSFFIGPQLTWRSFDYKKLKTVPKQNYEEFFVSLNETEILPYVSVFVDF